MEDWIFDRRLLQVGLLRINPKTAEKELPRLNAEFRGWKRASKHACRVLTFNRNFEHTLLYHRPFVESTFDYDVSNSLRLVGVTPEQYTELEHFMKGMVFRRRKLWVNWTFSSDYRCSFCVGYFKRLNDECYALPVEGDWFSVDNYSGGSRRHITPEEEQLATAFWKTWREIDDPRIKSLIRSDYKEVSLASSLDLLNLLTKEISAKCCPPSHYQLTIDLPDLKDTPHGPDIWHIWQNNWYAPKGFDRYALPEAPSVVRAYPIVNVESTHKSYGLDYALNVVHVRGESFVEVQAYECPELLQMTADVFGAPVDVWEGPLEDRFGWYGDATRGTTYRIEPKTTNTVLSELETVYVASPKKMWRYMDEKVREAPNIYQRPIAMASSLEELRSIAEAKKVDLFGDNSPELLLALTFRSQSIREEFDWDQFTTEVQDHARQLAGIGPDENFVEAMSEKHDQLPRQVQIELVKLLNLSFFRVKELSVNASDKEKILKVIGSKRVTRATDKWLANLLGQQVEWELQFGDVPEY